MTTGARSGDGRPARVLSPARRTLPNSPWIQKAAAMAAHFPLERLHPAVVAWAESRRVHARGPWAVAFSGGADSLALLLLLCAHWPERRARFVALHFNHRLRGAAADADERFCRRVCGALGVRLYVGRWNQRLAGAKHTKRGLAGCGRETCSRGRRPRPARRSLGEGGTGLSEAGYSVALDPKSERGGGADGPFCVL